MPKCTSFYEVQQRYTDEEFTDKTFNPCFVLQDQLPTDHERYAKSDDRWNLEDLRARFDDEATAIHVMEDVKRRVAEREEANILEVRVVRVTERLVA